MINQLPLIKGITGLNKIFRPSRRLFIILGALAVPAFVAIILFYGSGDAGGFFASIGFTKPQNELKQPAGDSNEPPLNPNLKLVDRNTFLAFYQPDPAILPGGSELITSLSGFLHTNSGVELLPVRNWSVPQPDIRATASISIEMPSRRILYGENIFEVRPIASLTKLMTALVAYEHLRLDDTVTISQKAFLAEGDSAGLVTGEQLKVEQLLYALLLESSNDAATALAEHYDAHRGANSDFVTLMNKKAGELKLADAFFDEPTGISPANRASAYTVSQLLYSAFQNAKLAEVMSSSSFTASAHNKDISHYWINLNTLLGAYEGILAGKTGYTEEAGPSMTVLAKSPRDGRHISVVVLDAEDRIEESRALLEWTNRAYIWQE